MFAVPSLNLFAWAWPVWHVIGLLFLHERSHDARGLYCDMPIGSGSICSDASKSSSDWCGPKNSSVRNSKHTNFLLVGEKDVEKTREPTME